MSQSDDDEKEGKNDDESDNNSSYEEINSIHSDKLVPAYLVVYDFLNHDWRDSFKPTIDPQGEIFLKSKINPYDVYNSLERETRKKFYLLFHVCNQDDDTEQIFAKSRNFQVLFILEKLYLASYFDNDGEFISKRVFNERYEKMIKFKNGEKPKILNPLSLIDLATVVVKNRLVQNKSHAIYLISKIPTACIIQIMRCRKTIPQCGIFCLNCGYSCPYCKIQQGKELRKALNFQFIDFLFDKHVPHCGCGDSDFDPAYYEDGITMEGSTRCCDSCSGGNRGGISRTTPIENSTIELFVKMKKALTPYLDFARLVFYKSTPNQNH